MKEKVKEKIKINKNKYLMEFKGKIKIIYNYIYRIILII